jgi:diguanylate cyclase (GGDEF)-like protein
VWAALTGAETVTADAELAEECLRLREAQMISRVGSWEFDVATSALTASDSMLYLFGLESTPTMSGFADVHSRVLSEDRAAADLAVEQFLLDGEDLCIRYRVAGMRGSEPGWIEARGQAFRDRRGTIVRLVGTVADITEHVQAETELREVHADLVNAASYQQAVITASPDAMHVYDVATGSITRANRLAPPFIGYTDEVIASMSAIDGLEALLPADDLAQLRAALLAAQSAQDGDVLQVRHRVLHGPGGVRWLSRRMTPFQRGDGGIVTQVLIVSRDETNLVAVEERLEHAALHDELTGLPNRRYIRSRLDEALHRDDRADVAVLFCDLDGFKRINDSHGHRTGDAVLVTTAARVKAATRGWDTVARVGGDEFVVVVAVPSGEEPYSLSETIARRLESSLSEPIVVDGREHTVTVSIGICVAQPGSTADGMLSEADTAMYETKTHGRNGHTFFRAELRNDTLGRDHTERQIRRALAEDSVEIHYQPVVDPSTGTVTAVEALVRIADVDGTHLDATQVIAVAEQTGLIPALDDRVLHMACRQTVAWRSDLEHADLRLSLNRSASDIAVPGFHDRINEALVRSGLDPRALTLEITETVMLDATASTLGDLQRLRDKGVGIALDDFGTGYASLRYLATLPITGLKIDRSFTAGVPHDRTAVTLVRAAIGLAEDLGLECVVEGVETEEQLRALPHYKGLYVQGYLYGRPVAADSAPRTTRRGDDAARGARLRTAIRRRLTTNHG